MPDIFDTLEATPRRDVFDTIAPDISTTVSLGKPGVDIPGTTYVPSPVEQFQDTGAGLPAGLTLRHQRSLEIGSAMMAARAEQKNAPAWYRHIGPEILKSFETTPEQLQQEADNLQQTKRFGQQIGALPAEYNPIPKAPAAASSIVPVPSITGTVTPKAEIPEALVAGAALQNELLRNGGELVSPESLLIMGMAAGAGAVPKFGQTIQRLAAGYFGIEGARGVVEGYREYQEAQTPEEKQKAIAHVLSGAAIAIPAGSHAISPRIAVPGRPEPTIIRDVPPMEKSAESIPPPEPPPTAAKSGSDLPAKDASVTAEESAPVTPLTVTETPANLAANAPAKTETVSEPTVDEVAPEPTVAKSATVAVDNPISRAGETRSISKQGEYEIRERAIQADDDDPSKGIALVYEVFWKGNRVGQYDTREFAESVAFNESLKDIEATEENAKKRSAKAAQDKQQPGLPIGQGPGARTYAPGGKPEPAESFEGTGLKHAIDELERVSYGFGERPRQERQAMAEAWVRSGEKLAANPLAGVQLADELARNPKRALSGDESALILRHKVALENAINNAAEKTFTGSPEEKISARQEHAAATDSLKILMDAVNRRGSEWGREGGWRQALAYEDYTFATQERLATASKGAPLTDGERATLQKELAERKAAADAYEKHLADKDSKIAEMEVKAALDRIALENANAPKYSEKVLAHAEKFASYMDQKGSEALARIKQRRSRMLTGIDPTELADLAIYGASKITRGLTNIAKWSAHMREAVGDWVKPHLDEIRKAAEARLEAELKNQVVFIKKTAGEKTGESVHKAVKEMTSGERQADLTAKIQARVKAGKSGEITVFVQKLARSFFEQGIKERNALVDAVHDVLRGIIPDFTRRQTMDAISGYGEFKQLSKDEIDVQYRAVKGQLQQVAKLEDMAAGKAPLKTGIERRAADDLERELIKLVNEAKKKGGYEVTDPAIQLASAQSTRLTALRNRITDLQNEITAGDRLIKKRAGPVTSPEIEALQAQLETVKAEHAAVFKTALEALKTRTAKRIAELEQKIVDQDFAPKARKPGPILDRKAQELLVKKLRVEQRLSDARRSWELKNRTTPQRIADFLTRWRREFVLSGPVSLAKLSAAAAEGLAFEPVKELAGRGVAAVFPRFAARTLVESRSSVKIEANAMKQAFMRTLDDAAQTLRTGKSDLEVAFGGRRPVPEEMVSYFGRLHAAIKTPLKRAVFERVYGKLSELGIRAGKDMADPLTQMEMGTIAMKEANRALFLEDNMLVQAYQRALSRFSEVDKTTGKVSTTGAVVGGALRLSIPIVRIPTNLVARTVQSAVGFPVGGVKLAIAYAKGIEKLPPEKADLIMRQLKQGSIGGAFLVAGFLMPQTFGGYYQKHEKRGPKEAKVASIKIGDANVPSFLLHHPLLEVFQVGATIRRVADSKLRKKDLHEQGVAGGALAGAIGLADEVPFGREIIDLGELNDPATRSNAIGKQLAGMTEPQALQWLARQFDKKIPFNPKEDAVKRKPHGIWQNIEMGIPGLREKVPAK